MISILYFIPILSFQISNVLSEYCEDIHLCLNSREVLIFQAGPSQYRGRGGRGGRPFRRGGRGRGRGQFNHGRGHGVGGGGHFPSHTSGPAISDVPGAPAAAGATSSISGQMTIPNSAEVPAASAQPLSRKMYCEVCKAECNSPEIMEQHKNGKRHKKNMKIHEELQRRNNLNGQQSGQIPTSQVNLADHPQKVQNSEKKECPTENMGSEITADYDKNEIKLQNNVGETSEVPAEGPEGNTTDNSALGDRGLKRKMRGGKVRRNAKKTTAQLSEAEQPTTFICELCNAKCESPAVYNSHMAGKKHLANLKRANGSQALPGAGKQTSSTVVHQPLPGVSGLQALYPSDVNALANAINTQVQQGDNDPQILLAQLLMTVISQGQGQAPAIPPTGPLAGQIPEPSSVPGLSHEQQLAQTQVSDITAHVEMENPAGETNNELLSEQQLAQTQVSDITAHVEMENPAGETNSELLSVSTEFNALAGSSVTQIEGGSSETKPSQV
ncbi:uncharacterized protein LOC130749109 isoform X2 [Lotus japonicus]|uniref:uncharacterized protein LOC130749109 isoform X2 n=1 Tax=Lotus japonicus TaxID=34305 RepID=UPI00258A9BAF|nr:uncharacterized protein LOC130749109 isoform X2 [Lotus japonicus]